MKKIFAVFALFIALIFVVSCGGSEDSGLTVGGRMWSSRSSSTYTWGGAVSYCDNLTEGGYSDWRLPNINELRTLIKNCDGSQAGGSCAVQDPSCLSSTCSSDSCYCDYMETNGGYYSKLGDPDGVMLCSSSDISDLTGYVWCVYFESGEVGSGRRAYDGISVRCVR